MENPGKFRLLYLPIIVIEEMISIMKPFELLSFSKISSRTKRIVKSSSSRKRTYEIRLGISNGPSVTFRGTEVHWELISTEDKTKDNLIEPYSHDLFLRYEYSENELQHFKDNYEYIKRILSYPITAVFYNLDAIANRNKSTIDWLKSHQEYVKEFLIYSTFGYDNDLKYLMSNVKATEYLKIHTQNELNFEWNGLLPENLHFLFIEASTGISFQQLMRTNSKTIVLRNSKITSREIHVFLKSWMESKSHLNLGSFEINIKNRGAMDTILDLPHQYVAYENAKIFKGYRTERTEVNRGIEIKQSSGRIGVMGTVTEGDKMSFKLFVF